MSVEISENQPPMELEISTKENANQPADGHLVMNGISNGYEEKHIKKEHKSDRDKDRHKEKHKHKDKDRDRDRDKEKNKDKSSSGKEKEKHSSSSSKDRDREKDRDKDRDRDRDKDREREKEKDREKKHKDEKRDKDREHKSSSSSKDKEHKSSSSSKDKEKHSSSSSSKDKEKDRHSSSHRDKEKERDKEKDKHSSSSKDKDKHHSSSNREKDRHSSSPDKKHSDKDKHRSKDKEKDRESKDKVKKPDEQKERKEKSEKNEMKTDIPVKTDELLQEVEKVVVKEELLTEIKEEVQDEIGVGMTDSINDSLVNDTYENTSVDTSSFRIKSEEDTEDEVPLHGFTAVKSMRTAQVVKREVQEESDEDDVPLSARKKVKKEVTVKKKKRKADSDEETFKPEKKKKMKTETKVKTESQAPESPRKGKKKEEQQQEVWKWWEEEKKDDGTKWNFLEHKGPVFAPPYERLPPDVKFYYDGKEMRLSEEAEEVATFYARMLDHDYTTKEAFNKNFFKDWRKMMTSAEKETITDLSKCNFKHMHAYFVQKSEERKAMSKEEKKKIKEQNEEIVKEYGFCVIDGHKERIGNFKIEPPGLFRGRGEHPKMGMLKRRVVPEDVIINCSKDSEIPKAPDGRKWKEVRHDKTVTWLASWTENVQGQVKYVMLNPSSKLKGEKDWQKYETARKLAKTIDKIRNEYREDWRSKEMRIRQRAVALYFIDKLALRAGNEKDEDQADTVGCCSLRVEHIQLHEEKDGKENVVVFDFLGKDSIRYYNEVSVEKRVFKNLQLFMQNKSTGDDLFDRLNTTVLNKHLNELMEGLTAKVFRTYNASITLQEQLKALTDPEYSVAEKILAYNRANRAVAILCNHQRAVPKTHAKSMENLKNKIETKREQVEEAERQYKQAKKEHKNHGTAKNKIDMDKRKKAFDRLREQLAKLEVQATDKEENKEIALGTSKLNYLDPRISVAWCKKFDVPIERIYNKTQREKFRWAIDMAGPDYIF